jgi:prevent-host-death family protein
MRGKTIDINDVKTHLSRLIARVERGERIIIARAGKPVAELRPVRKKKRPSIPVDDALLRVDEYAYDGPIDPTTNRDIDRTVCGV